MAAKALMGLILLQGVSGQGLNVSVSGDGICETVHCRDLNCLQAVDKCVTILGNFTFIYPRQEKKDTFSNMTFSNLKEITGYMALYQVPVLESVGQLFPNLVRIRGHYLLHNYALIIYDMNQLSEINLHSLLKIDHGGVIIWGGPNTCNIDTVDWKTIAPGYRHVLSPSNEDVPCNRMCRCSGNPAYNYCWNMWKCQRYTEGPEALDCHEECLGCRLTDPNECMICRHYTYKQQCVPKCPDDTIILEDNQYCITEEECHNLRRWVWNNTCANACPDNYVIKNVTKGKKKTFTCEYCPSCKEYCGNVTIMSLGSIQATHRCVFINGSLTIHIRVPEAIEEMHIHLSRIQEVYDYIAIHDSISLVTVDFLPSLRRIRGRKLKDNKYSLVIRDNSNLQTVFPPNVTKNLKIDNGAIDILRNPMLCMSEIDKLKKLFPQAPNGTQNVPHGYSLNSYSGCEEVSLNIKVSGVNETSALVKFVPVPNTQLHYTILYVRVPPGKYTTVVPETCSEYEWNVVSTDDSGRVQLTDLRPASTYLLCIEWYDVEEKHLKRSSIVNFSTAVGKPEPPFIMELVADTPHLVVLHWVDHVDYVSHITRYELSVMLIDINPEDITAINQCRYIMEDALEELDVSRHAVVMRPPRDYSKGCESMCGMLSTAPHGAMVEEDFDICKSMGSACDEIDEEPAVTNTSFGYFIRTMSLSVNGPRNAYQIGDLAPYRDYRFRLRACTKDLCSRSSRGVVRTLPSMAADVPTISAIGVNKGGHITVAWRAPEVSNGPVLAYILKLLPDIKSGGIEMSQTQIWCVPANQTEIVVNSEKGKDYTVQLCSMSLASRSGCTESKKLFGSLHHSKDLMWAGVFFALSLCISSLLVGYLWTSCRTQSDTVPLVDITSSYRIDSEPPVFSLLDFSPSLHVSRTDSNDY